MPIKTCKRVKGEKTVAIFTCQNFRIKKRSITNKKSRKIIIKYSEVKTFKKAHFFILEKFIIKNKDFSANFQPMHESIILSVSDTNKMIETKTQRNMKHNVYTKAWHSDNIDRA